MRDRLKSRKLREIYDRNSSFDSNFSQDHDMTAYDCIMELLSDAEVVRRLSVSCENKNINTVEEFMTEVISTISEINKCSRSDSVKKLKGIIKKTLHCDQKRDRSEKNRVHFSEENIYIEIPRPPQSVFKMMEAICCFYCCFGFLFPNY